MVSGSPFWQLMRQRRMVRNFTAEPVPWDTVESLLDLARRAPSAGNTQAVRFVVVTEPGPRRQLAEAAGERWYVAAGHAPFLSRAPVHVVVCTSEAAYRARYREPDKRKPAGGEPAWAVPWWYVDAGAALMALLLAAVDAGLGAAFVGVRDPGQPRTLLGLPPEVLPIGIVALGHPAPDKPTRSRARPRLPLEEVIRREAW